MPAELALRLTGGRDNTDPALSLGGETSVWPVALHDLFGPVSFADAMGGLVEHRGLAVVNEGNQGARRVRAWTEVGPDGEANLELGYSDRPDWHVRCPEGRAELAPRDHFSRQVTLAPHGPDAPLELPELAPGNEVRLWLRRTIAPKSGGGKDQERLRLTWL